MLKNPDFPNRRGCFIDPTTLDKNGECQVVDYPTYHIRKGEWVTGANPPIPEDQEYTATFNTRAEALAFCEKENYLVCQRPGEKPVERPSETED